MYSQVLDSSTAIVIKVDKIFATLEYIDKMARPDLCGKTKIVKVSDLPENSREINSIVNVSFKSVKTHYGYLPSISIIS